MNILFPQSQTNHANSRFGHRCYTLHTEGRILYDPERNGRKDEYWCIIEIEKDITRYYREQFKRRFGISLFAPAFDAHVSVLRGYSEYTEKMAQNWGYMNHKEVTIHYDSNLYWNDKHVWLNTCCFEYFDIREYYNVKDWNIKDFSHLTIGKFTA